MLHLPARSRFRGAKHCAGWVAASGMPQFCQLIGESLAKLTRLQCKEWLARAFPISSQSQHVIFPVHERARRKIDTFDYKPMLEELRRPSRCQAPFRITSAKPVTSCARRFRSRNTAKAE